MIKEVKMENKKKLPNLTQPPEQTEWLPLFFHIQKPPSLPLHSVWKKSHQLSVVVGCSSSPAKQKAGLYYILLVPEKLPKETSL